ncbi:MAG: OB-fold nucleic acid binding domain-containing protein [Candidatus Bathyarchaeota archaeon]|nr:OB-fold nucleic acid binding domain-containing protein [Candidatus Bathyarchaeota archaeon]MDH5713710.1 OB-fold nucleic acid binding domain-containing protein [Candidatus Bathyarchaeota archaeon]
MAPLKLFSIGRLVNIYEKPRRVVSEDELLNIHDLKPGMDHVNLKVEVLNISEPKQIITGTGIEHDILEVEVKDETGSIALVLWDERILPLKVGDTLQIENGFVSSFKGKWRINVGKYGDAKKI